MVIIKVERFLRSGIFAIDFMADGGQDRNMLIVPGGLSPATFRGLKKFKILCGPTISLRHKCPLYLSLTKIKNVTTSQMKAITYFCQWKLQKSIKIKGKFTLKVKCVTQKYVLRMVQYLDCS